jgi:hypothetical protein
LNDTAVPVEVASFMMALDVVKGEAIYLWAQNLGSCNIAIQMPLILTVD